MAYIILHKGIVLRADKMGPRLRGQLVEQPCLRISNTWSEWSDMVQLDRIMKNNALLTKLKIIMVLRILHLLDNNVRMTIMGDIHAGAKFDTDSGAETSFPITVLDY